MNVAHAGLHSLLDIQRGGLCGQLPVLRCTRDSDHSIDLGVVIHEGIGMITHGETPCWRHTGTARRLAVAMVTVLSTLILPADAAAQVVVGRVVDEGDGRVVATALVRLLDEEGEYRSFVLADSVGLYRLVIDEPGEYFLLVERIGYVPFRSPLLAFSIADGTYPIDLQVSAAPLGLPGLTVTAEQRAAGDQRIRLHVGRNPSSLRIPLLTRADIENHIDKARDFEHVVRWTDTPSITVKLTTEGPCFQYRQRHCIEVFLDGFHVNPEVVNTLPLDIVESVVILLPNESIVYEAGAILLFTAGWFR